MDTATLQRWLGLPPGPWPPDGRALLGLPDGPLDPAAVEQRALEQMDRLRPHQLVHPDLVTEGMNRLAQALVTLSDEAAPGGPPPAGESAPEPRPPDDDSIELDLDVIQGVNTADPAVAEPDTVLEAEAVLDAEAVEPAAPPPPGRLPTDRLAVEAAAPPAVAPVPDLPPAPPGVAFRPDERRKGYRRLVRHRKLLREWEKLGPYFGNPGERLFTPAAVFGYLDAVQGLNGFIDAHRFDALPTNAGSLVWGVVRQPLSLAVFRTLVPSQRLQVASDWATATAELRAAVAGLRQSLRETQPSPTLGQALRQVRAYLRDNPEWLPLSLVAVAAVIGLARSAVR